MHTDTTVTWSEDLASLHQVAEDLILAVHSSSDWHLLLEFCVPRKERRLDAVLLTGSEIILLECKRGAATLKQ